MDGIAEPLVELQPSMPPEDHAIRARTLLGRCVAWSASAWRSFRGLPLAR